MLHFGTHCLNEISLDYLINKFGDEKYNNCINRYAKYYECVNCDIIVYKNSSLSNIMFSGLNNINAFKLTCDEVIIKNIIE